MPVEMEQTNVQLHAVQLDARSDSGAVRNYVATHRLINCIIGRLEKFRSLVNEQRSAAEKLRNFKENWALEISQIGAKYVCIRNKYFTITDSQHCYKNVELISLFKTFFSLPLKIHFRVVYFTFERFQRWNFRSLKYKLLVWSMFE